jgi:hypothetical protein
LFTYNINEFVQPSNQILPQLKYNENDWPE